jgi:uroporphyrinogen-III synthase
MIPMVVPPLRGASILVTRPLSQAVSLTQHIQRLGGEAVPFPALAIEAVAAELAPACDLVVFVSTNAVAHGSHLITRNSQTRVAAIGKATAAALAALDIQVDFMPAADANSEALLAHPELTSTRCATVLIVRGVGGRTLLQESFAALGAEVRILEVYRRVCPVVDPATLALLASRWSADEIDIVTVTSVETLTNLFTQLGDAAADLLRRTPLLVASARIRDAALSMACCSDIVLARGADDESLIGALCYWRTRNRIVSAFGEQLRVQAPA